jgi:hypothetical protein
MDTLDCGKFGGSFNVDKGIYGRIRQYLGLANVAFILG